MRPQKSNSPAEAPPELSFSTDLPSAAPPEVWTGGWGTGACAQPFPGKFAFGLEIKAFHPYH
jgi:hypothetical protein